jgi:hypothetical protein
MGTRTRATSSDIAQLLLARRVVGQLPRRKDLIELDRPPCLAARSCASFLTPLDPSRLAQAGQSPSATVWRTVGFSGDRQWLICLENVCKSLILDTTNLTFSSSEVARRAMSLDSRASPQVSAAGKAQRRANQYVLTSGQFPSILSSGYTDESCRRRSTYRPFRCHTCSHALRSRGA